MYGLKKLFFVSLIYLLIMIFSNSEATAQCVACYQSANGDCSTEIVDRDGAMGCGCDTGCNCTGQCEYDPGSGDIMFLNDNIDDSNIPETGLVFNAEFLKESGIIEYFSEGGYIGDEKVNRAMFSESNGAYRISENEIVIFPLKDDKFDLKNCHGEFMASISKNPL